MLGQDIAAEWLGADRYPRATSVRGNRLTDSFVATDRPVRWGLGDVGLGLFAVLASYVLIGGPLLAVTGYADTDEAPLWLATVFQMLPWIGFIGAPVLAARLKGNGVVVDFGLRQRWTDVPLGVATGVATQVVVVFGIYWPLEQIFGGLDVSGEARDVVDPAQGLGVALLIVVVVFGAPFAEELFWRGLTYQAIDRKWGPVLAIVGSAGVFALLHLQPIQFVGLFFFGLVAGWLVRRTDRLGPSIWAHVGFNATTVAVLVATR